MVNFALDIETTGLNPWTDRVVTAAVFGDLSRTIDEPAREYELLYQLRNLIDRAEPEGELVTWNGSEFDLPFLAVRYALNGMITGPRLVPLAEEVGKYGKPRYGMLWGAMRHTDIAYIYKGKCEDEGIAWSLKPTARALLGEDPYEVKFEEVVGTQPCIHPREFGGMEHEYDPVIKHRTILDIDKIARQDYCLSDAVMTWKLHERLHEHAV